MLWAAVRNNVAWIVVGTLSPLVISLVLAVLLWANTWARHCTGSCSFSPMSSHQ